MKIAIIGSNGQLGSDLVQVLSADHEVAPLTHHDIEITDIDSVQKAITQLQPDFILNTAAYHNVPQCEKEPDLAFRINGTGVLNLAKVCKSSGTRLVHYSTDYVFDGKKAAPYSEKDLPNPLSVYGTTKLAGEYYALNYCPQSFVVRVSGIYGKVPSRLKGGNFITTMIKLAQEKPEVKVVDDEITAPTPTHEIAKATAELIKTDAYGLYHMSCDGECSWYEFAKVIWETLGLKTPLYPAKVSDFPSVVERPAYSVMDNTQLTQTGVNKIANWKECLVDFLKQNHL